MTKEEIYTTPNFGDKYAKICYKNHKNEFLANSVDLNSI